MLIILIDAEVKTEATHSPGNPLEHISPDFSPTNKLCCFLFIRRIQLYPASYFWFLNQKTEFFPFQGKQENNLFLPLPCWS